MIERCIIAYYCARTYDKSRRRFYVWMRVCVLISDGWEISSRDETRRDSTAETHGQLVFMAAGDDAQPRRHVSVVALIKLVSSPGLLLCSALLCSAAPAEAPAVIKGGRERHEALAEVKANLLPHPPARTRDKARRQGKVEVVGEHLPSSCCSRRASALLPGEVNWQAETGMGE